MLQSKELRDSLYYLCEMRSTTEGRDRFQLGLDTAIELIDVVLKLQEENEELKGTLAAALRCMPLCDLR